MTVRLYPNTETFPRQNIKSPPPRSLFYRGPKKHEAEHNHPPGNSRGSLRAIDLSGEPQQSFDSSSDQQQRDDHAPRPNSAEQGARRRLLESTNVVCAVAKLFPYCSVQYNIDRLVSLQGEMYFLISNSIVFLGPYQLSETRQKSETISFCDETYEQSRIASSSYYYMNQICSSETLIIHEISIFRYFWFCINHYYQSSFLQIFNL